MSEEKPHVSDTLTFQIKTDRFEGPLELLLELVEKRKLLINDISLAEVTDEYMRTVANMQEQSLPHTAQFVSLAATLLLLKSKSLLPVLELTEEETEKIDELESMLKYYQVFRDAGEQVRTSFGTEILHERTFVPGTPLFQPDTFCTVSTLHNSLEELVRELPFPEQKPKVRVAPVVTLEAMIEKLRQRIERDFKTRFSDIQAGETERKAVVVCFLAILELYKQGSILVHQSVHFADIEIESDSLSTPQYR